MMRTLKKCKKRYQTSRLNFNLLCHTGFQNFFWGIPNLNGTGNAVLLANEPIYYKQYFFNSSDSDDYGRMMKQHILLQNFGYKPLWPNYQSRLGQGQIRCTESDPRNEYLHFLM